MDQIITEMKANMQKVWYGQSKEGTGLKRIETLAGCMDTRKATYLGKQPDIDFGTMAMARSSSTFKKTPS